jgi:hypothetical protein
VGSTRGIFAPFLYQDNSVQTESRSIFAPFF